MKKTIITALLPVAGLLFSFADAGAQDAPRKSFEHTIAVQPFYWANNGFRFDYERQLKNPAQWLQVSAIGYYVEDGNSFWTLSSNESNINSAWGAGFEANYKYFPSGNVWYVSAGVAASHFSVQYDRLNYSYESYTEEGLTYYEPQVSIAEESQHVTRLGTNFFTGIQNRPYHRFLIDAYIGFGRVFSIYDKDKYSSGNYLNALGYRGLTLTMGVRIGFRL
jgi:hypothetical protein